MTDATAPVPTVPGFPVDGHVHLHRIDRVASTLDAAAANFAAACGRRAGLLGAILLTEAAGERVFVALGAQGRLGGWTFESVPDETESLIARRGDAALAIVCGRQIRCANGLEVLALGTQSEFAERGSLRDTVAAVGRAGAVTVIPWGFGKWWGGRGREVEATLAMLDPGSVFVGDNGSRIAWLGRPPLLRAAVQRGYGVIPGSDPFPVAGDGRRVGRFGCLAARRPPETSPWRSLREQLGDRANPPVPFGKASGLGRFVLNQVGIRLRSR